VHAVEQNHEAHHVYERKQCVWVRHLGSPRGQWPRYHSVTVSVCLRAPERSSPTGLIPVGEVPGMITERRNRQAIRVAKWTVKPLSSVSSCPVRYF
jgi:hypothetical protein